ncbi:hypothetical protein [Streptomyces sp. NPDC097981]|uniref:hypothetical protein n=1 Tax=Streptomyces sp. NPDC097981 TaxID=3155428 RepID=UPI00331C94EE
MNRDDLDTLFASPATLLAVGPEALEDLPATGGGAGREAYAQAVTILDGAEVPRAEFASWLHFGAKVLGHDDYADLVAEAEPCRGGPSGPSGARQASTGPRRT